MSVNLKILKYIFAVLGIIVSGFVAFRPEFSHIGVFFVVCYIGYLLLASPFFYPAFYGNKWDYLRIILFTENGHDPPSGSSSGRPDPEIVFFSGE